MDFDRIRCRIIERQIESCQGLVDMQRELIAEKKARGFDTSGAESLLASFERNHALLEEQLAAIGGAGR
jgi:hypothetical protein